MSLRKGACAPLLLALAMVGGCQANGVASQPAQTDEFSQDSDAKVMVPLASGRVECSGPCRVDLFDGTSLSRLVVGADGMVSFPATESVVFVSARGQIPQVKLVGPQQPLGVVHLESAPDAQKGYLAVAAVRVAAGGKRKVPPRLLPVAGAQLSIVGPAGDTLVTGGDGILIAPLAAARYSINSGGERKQVDVQQGETAVLPIVMGRAMVD